MRIVSRGEVLLHNKKTDCWVIVRNKVFDLTTFIEKHPGGADILLSRAGEDATSFFLTKHGHKKHIEKQLEAYQIGIIELSEQLSSDDYDEPFLIELINACYKENLYKAPIWYKNKVFYIRTGNILLFFLLSFIVLYLETAWYISLSTVILQALIGSSLFGFIAHENTHRNFPKNIFLKRLLTFSWPIFWPFITQKPLRYEHNSHHIKIGDPEFDYEVAGFSQFIRYSSYIEHSPIHSKQHRIAKLLYPFYANIITTVGGIKSGFWEKHNRKVGLEHTLSILWTLSYFIIIPSLINSNFIWNLVLYVVYQSILFYNIYITAAINHFVPSSVQPIPKEHSNKYGYYVCSNTANFCIKSKFWFWLSGGFNIQIEHHLIPFVPVENLKKMIPIVQVLCKKYNYPYTNYMKFNALWQDHYEYLKELSSDVDTTFTQNERANKSSYQAR